MKEKHLRLKQTMKVVLIGLLLGAAGVTKGFAYDFSAVCETGQTLYFNIIDENNQYVEVVPPYYDDSWYGYTKPTGNVIIPTLILNEGTNYAVTSIGKNAFWACYEMTSVTIPNSVTSIVSGFYNSFRECRGLEQIIVEARNRYFDSREDCNAIIETESNTLIVGSKNSFIPNSVTSIESYAFSYCRDLSSNLDIPNSVTSIGICAFQYCSNLTSVNIGNSLSSIESYVFYGCNNLASVTISSIVVPTIGVDVFADVYSVYQVPNIYVPYESLNAYKTAANWSDYESRIFPWLQKSIAAHGETDGWDFIASPLTTESLAPTAVENMIPANGNYDLYRFDQSEQLEWQNYKVNNFSLANGQGYLYANAEDANIIFKGEFNEDETKDVDLVYDANADLPGWNLVGNPFPVQAHASRSYYKLDETGSYIVATPVSSSTAITPCTGIMVKAEATETEPKVTFSKTVSDANVSNGFITVEVVEPVETPAPLKNGPSTLRQAQGSGTLVLDKAIFSFNEGDRLEKFVFNAVNAQISIPQGGKDYAIATIGGRNGVHTVSTEQALNFKPTKNGNYTITINPENVDLDYLHLIDNLTGADVDLLASPTYTFTAKTTDYPSRFRLVFSANEAGASTGSAAFAYFNNGNIIINNADARGASLQLIDAFGRVLVYRNTSHVSAATIPTNGMAPGIYVLCLVNGDGVKTQKIVID